MKLQKLKKYVSLEANEAIEANQAKEARHGFTLIETLVAVTILSVAIVGPMTIAAKGLSFAMFARDQITAFYLAQEAVEMVRNRRDQNTLQTPPQQWLSGLDGSIGPPDCFTNACKGEAKDNEITECAGDCPKLKFNSSTGLYGYGSGGNWEDSKYTREISLSPVNANEIAVTVKLEWSTGIFSRTFLVKENLLNWQQ
jgi:prepilin-type N-terminal cleavage/methylation domain-containing protein